MAKHRPDRERPTRWLQLGGMVLLLALVATAGAAGPVLFRASGPERTQATPQVAPPSPSASAPSPRAARRAAPIVPRTTLKPEPEPTPAPRVRNKKKAAQLRAAAEAALTPPVTFRLASFNVLGSSHTGGGGNKPGYAEGPVRMGWIADLLRGSGVEVVGFQEYEPNQHNAFVRRTGGSWGVFPGMSMGSRGVRNSVAWSTAAWTLVEARTTTIPYFRTPAVIPYVLLEHRETGQQAWFISIHNPTSNAKRGNNQQERNIATQRERSLMADLHSSGTPVFLTGDFNERGEAFCQVTAGGAAQAAQGGSGGPPCQPPGAMGIDWIFGTPDVTFSGYLRRQDAAVRRASDHPLILATATLPGE